MNNKTQQWNGGGEGREEKYLMMMFTELIFRIVQGRCLKDTIFLLVNLVQGVEEGRYGIVYLIQDDELTVWVVRVGHRKHIYR